MMRRFGAPGMHGVAGLGLGDLGVACPGGAVRNGLLNNLIAYWPGNEINGNALDAHVNALHLTDTNTVTSNPGVVYALARQYTAANLEYHMRLADDALLSTGDIDFTLASWCYMDSKPAAIMAMSGKFHASAGNREYHLCWNNATDRLMLRVSADGIATTNQTAATFGAPALSVWMLVLGWHDSVANTINIQVNNGAVDSTPYATGVFDGTARFAIGAARNPAAASLYWDGRIGPTAFWKSNAGLGGVLTVAQKTALYNGGLGLPYSQFTV